MVLLSVIPILLVCPIIVLITLFFIHLYMAFIVTSNILFICTRNNTRKKKATVCQNTCNEKK